MNLKHGDTVSPQRARSFISRHPARSTPNIIIFPRDESFIRWKRQPRKSSEVFRKIVNSVDLNCRVYRKTISDFIRTHRRRKLTLELIREEFNNSAVLIVVLIFSDCQSNSLENNFSKFHLILRCEIYSL